MKTRSEEIEDEIFEHLKRRLSEETKAKLLPSETKEIIESVSEYVMIQNFHTIFDHLHKFQKALIDKTDETPQSGFMEELKNV